MALHRFNEFNQNPNYAPDNFFVRNFGVYSDRNEKIGTVVDGLLDPQGTLQYMVVALSSWSVGKQVLVPLRNAQIDLQRQCVYVPGLSQRQVANLPAYHTHTVVDHQHEEQVRGVYQMRSLEESAPLEASAPLEGYQMPPVIRSTTPISPTPTPAPVPPAPVYTNTAIPPLTPVPPTTSRPDAIPPSILPEETTVSSETIPLLEERVVVDHRKRKVGEVIVRKEIETEIIEVPVQREKLIVEQVGSEHKQLAEIDLTEDDEMGYPQYHQRQVELPPLPRRNPTDGL